MPARSTLLLVLFLILAESCSAHAECIDLSKSRAVSFEGNLTYHIFPGPPNYEDVRKGDTPEPMYILRLNRPICVSGDNFLSSDQPINDIQIYPADPDQQGSALWSKIRRLAGTKVLVAGNSAFGAHTGHHHAPLVLPITSIMQATDLTSSYGTAMTTVEAFYSALRAGDGREASAFVVPEKRSTGPLSASAITRFYQNLYEPLSVIDIVPLGGSQYQVRYTYRVSNSNRCDGEAVVQTVQRNGFNLIQSIRAMHGC